MKKSRACIWVMAWLLLAPWAQAQNVQPLMRQSDSHSQQAQAAQARINALDDEANLLAQSHRATLQKIDNLQTYNEQLRTLIAAQRERQTQLRTQIDNVITIERMVVPIMLQSLDALEQFVVSDLPFRPMERKQRLADLQDLLARVDVSAAEKYRKLMEAYEIELEYGRTIGAYQGLQDSGEDARSVNFLRIGRLALMYQTLDGSESAVWDRQNQTWQPVRGALARAMRDNLAIAREQLAPALMLVPLKGAHKEGTE